MSDNHDPTRLEFYQARLTAYALGQLDYDERTAVEAELHASSEARQFVEEIRALAGQVREAARHQPLPQPAAGLRDQLTARLDELEASPMITDDTRPTPAKKAADNKRTWRPWLVAACVLLLSAGGLAAVFAYMANQRRGTSVALQMLSDDDEPVSSPAAPAGRASPVAFSDDSDSQGESLPETEEMHFQHDYLVRRPGYRVPKPNAALSSSGPGSGDATTPLRVAGESASREKAPTDPFGAAPAELPGAGPGASGESEYAPPAGGDPPLATQPPPADSRPFGVVPPTPDVTASATPPATPPAKSPPYRERRLATELHGTESGSTPDPAQPIPRRDKFTIPPGSQPRVADSGVVPRGEASGEPADRGGPADGRPLGEGWRYVPGGTAPGTEQYDQIVENEFLAVGKAPLSTFSIDVDTASYANVRRFLSEGRLPPPNAVRIEELVNYFKYRYPQPDDQVPFSVGMEVTQCPWQGEHRLLKVGLKGREIDREQRGPSNLVFLLDVSGSMSSNDKLPLAKQAMRLLVQQLTEDDRVAIVTYASNAGLRLESTCGEHQDTILAAVDGLQAGGSTHGSAGIQLAYQQATKHFVSGGVNRVVLCTDGDLNVGITRDEELVHFIEDKAKTGVFLTVLGFGTGNLKDSKMEKLADKGNGIYAYIDNLREARKVLVEQMTGSLVTIAKDVKIQIEFNPAEVAAYRLIGYENRVLAARDFDDDRKDAGEIGAGHTVTALYELVPTDSGHSPAGGRPLKYQQAPAGNLTDAAASGELLTLRLRYKEPDGQKSRLLEFAVADEGKRFGEASPDFQFAAAVAAFGMILRGSQYAGDATLAAIEEYAVSGLGDDQQGYRAEFVDLVRRARQFAPR